LGLLIGEFSHRARLDDGAVDPNPSLVIVQRLSLQRRNLVRIVHSNDSHALVALVFLQAHFFGLYMSPMPYTLKN